jgi:hypothetical protein
VSLHHGGGGGMGFSQHAGMVIVCDGAEAAAKRIARVLWNDSATGVMRHADAGYEIALDCAKQKGLDLPGILLGRVRTNGPHLPGEASVRASGPYPPGEMTFSAHPVNLRTPFAVDRVAHSRAAGRYHQIAHA